MKHNSSQQNSVAKRKWATWHLLHWTRRVTRMNTNVQLCYSNAGRNFPSLLKLMCMVALRDFRLLQWFRLRYKYRVMLRRVDWQLVPDVSNKSIVSSWVAVLEEFFLDYLTTILRNLCNYLPVNTEYYSRRIKSLTSMAAGCFDTANRRKTKDINKPICKSSSVFVSYRPASVTTADRYGMESWLRKWRYFQHKAAIKGFYWLQQHSVVNLTVPFFHNNIPGATDRDNLEIENGLCHRWKRVLPNRITLLLWQASCNPRAAEWLSSSVCYCSTSYSNCTTQNFPWKAVQETFVL
jgi:hypothetical protein